MNAAQCSAFPYSRIRQNAPQAAIHSGSRLTANSYLGPGIRCANECADNLSYKTHTPGHRRIIWK
jgi:hypothetical protein